LRNEVATMRKGIRFLLSFGVASCAAIAVPATAITFNGIDVQLNGNASMVGGALQLTPGVDGQAGSAWGTAAWDATTSFTTTYSFSLDEAGSKANSGFGAMADGFAFVLHNDSSGISALGGDGGDIGYAGINNSVASIVQTFDNNEVGFATSSGWPFGAPTAPGNLGAASLVTGTQTVSYDAANHLLAMTGTIWIDGTPHSVSDSQAIDLSTFGNTLYAGFTGATGGAWADQRITSWTVTPVPEPHAIVLALAGLGMIGAMARRRSER
jgi:MYXO-CTERM domain-containing protein